MHDEFCKHNYNFLLPPGNLYTFTPYVPKKDNTSIDWLVHIIVNSIPKYNERKNLYRYIFTLEGCKKVSVNDIKKNRKSFLHEWKRIPLNRQCSNDYFTEKQYKQASLSPNLEKKYVKFSDYYDIKIICRDFILAERYISLLQQGCLDDCKIQNGSFNFDKSIQKRKSSKLFPFKSSKMVTKRPVSMNVQVR